ncbi:MAG: hypothetical protein J3R72DRAFT_459187 [Linnemannia gamsii]|nr:MAG: hypothetical protein J3R72DRAFT_459187 [Linnemannia gamsii]
MATATSLALSSLCRPLHRTSFLVKERMYYPSFILSIPLLFLFLSLKKGFFFFISLVPVPEPYNNNFSLSPSLSLLPLSQFTLLLLCPLFILFHCHTHLIHSYRLFFSLVFAAYNFVLCYPTTTHIDDTRPSLVFTRHPFLHCPCQHSTCAMNNIIQNLLYPSLFISPSPLAPLLLSEAYISTVNDQEAMALGKDKKEKETQSSA